MLEKLLATVAQYLVASSQTTADHIRAHSEMPFIHFSPYAPKRLHQLTDASSQTGLTWLLTSFDEPSLLAMVAGAEQLQMLICHDWISLWLFEIQTLLLAIAAHLNGDQNAPFLKPADAE